MGKVRDKMDAAIREKRTFFSFEFFPPRTPEVSSPLLYSGCIKSCADHRSLAVLAPMRSQEACCSLKHWVVLPVRCTHSLACFTCHAGCRKPVCKSRQAGIVWP